MKLLIIIGVAIGILAVIALVWMVAGAIYDVMKQEMGRKGG